MDEIKRYARSRVTIHRQYRRLLDALTCLVEHKVIAKSEYKNRRKRIDQLYKRQKEKRKATRPKSMRPHGRPPILPQKCRKDGCDRMATNGYCSVEHAPLARYGFKRTPAIGTE